MCQPTTTITAKVDELMNLKKLAEELQNQMEAITDEMNLAMMNYMPLRGLLSFSDGITWEIIEEIVRKMNGGE